MMADSAAKGGGRERTKKSRPLFSSAFAEVVKDNKARNEMNKKKFEACIKRESFSENLSSSKNTSNEFPIDPIKPVSNFRQSVGQDRDIPDFNVQTSRNSRTCGYSGENHSKTEHHHNTEKSKFSYKSKSNNFAYESNFLRCSNSLVDASCAETFQHSSTSKHSVPNSIHQEKLSSNDEPYKGNVIQASKAREYFDDNDDSPDYIMRRRRSKSHSRSKESNEYQVNDRDDFNVEKKSKSDFSNSDPHIDSSPAKTSKHKSNFTKSDFSDNSHTNFNKDSLIFKHTQFNEESNSYYHTKNISHPSQHHNFHKDNFSKNPYKSNSSQFIKLKESKNTQNYRRDKNYREQKDNSTIENCLIYDPTQKSHERFCSKSDKILKDSKLEDLKITIKNSVSDVIPELLPVQSSSLIPCNLDTLNPPANISASSVSFTSVSPNISPTYPVSDISRTSVTLNTSPTFSPVSTMETAFDLPSDMVGNSMLITDNLGILCSSNDNFIPPPEAPDASDKLYISANVTHHQSIESESVEDFYEDEAYFSLPDSAYLEALSNFIIEVIKERSVPNFVADRVVNDLNRLFKNHFEGNVIDYYGSYYMDLAITTSDINLMVEANVSVKKSFIHEIYKILSEELEKYHVHQYEEGINAYKTKINFTHPDTGINCQLVYLGKYKKSYIQMGKFIKEMCNMDDRVKLLIIATKVWAEHLHINEVEDGKLHPVAFILAVIYFLQHCENPVLPVCSYKENFNDYIQNLKDQKQFLLHNDLSVGALWLSFLWFYTYTFNWQEDILSVTSENRVSKKSKNWENYWIAIEDPYTGKNIADSVTNKDIAENIKSCFRQTYNYFMNGQEIMPSSDNDENQSSAGSSSSQIKFSFSDCIVEQNENICEKCEEIDDVCDECKKKIYVQPMVSVPKMTDDFLRIIKKALLTVYNKYVLSDEEVEDRRQFVKNLEKDVHKIYPDAQMRLFGSSANGFGFKNSDLDICLKFKSKKEVKAIPILKDLRYLLRSKGDFCDVIAIFNAQIPILKFRYKPQGWRGDISLDNVLAVYNSELLYTYSLIDERCKILGCALKLLAKKALIAEVTEKALSSYSYLIMLIHFLQQTDPPVLPVLQDNQFRDNFELNDIVDSCNVWFCRDINCIKNTFKNENTTPIEQLFLDLLDYYCSFDCNNVITIRQKEILPLSSCEKMRTARSFNIQDPFIVDKNLGCVVSPTKAQETKSVFNRARILFRTPKKEPPTDLENYFFSTMSLTGRYQKEALCELCGKFGHDEKNCKQSAPLKNKFFKCYPRRYQFPNPNYSFKRKQINRQCSA